MDLNGNLLASYLIGGIDGDLYEDVIIDNGIIHYSLSY